MKGGKMTKRFGFTLAEVLVTLTIIGVVASMTVPTLMNSTSTQEYSAGYKKMMSTLNQAITMQYALDGTDMRNYKDISGTAQFAEPDGVAAMLMNRLQVVSTAETRSGKHQDGSEASDDHSNSALYLSDGMVIQFPTAFTQSTECKKNTTVASEEDISKAGDDECLYTIMIDVNGDKGKCFWSDQTTTENQKGKNAKLNPGDCFPVDVYPDGVKPADWVGRQIMFNGK